MRYPEEIENYAEKSKFLKEHGWETWHHLDNWIKTEWREQGKKIDNAGCSTDDAYGFVNASERKDGPGYYVGEYWFPNWHKKKV